MGDVQGQAAAANFIGVNYMYLTCGTNEGMLHASFSKEADSVSNISCAIEFHEKHLRLANVGGTNIIVFCIHVSQ